MKNSAIVLAAGSGSRMHSEVKKQYIEIAGKPLIYYSLNIMEKSFIDEVILVVSQGDIDYVKECIVEKYGFKKVKAIVEGGKQRYNSVQSGLSAVSSDCDYVFIHDGARPFITEDILERAKKAVIEYKACVVGMPVKDTIKIADKNGFTKTTPDRSTVWAVQTPQVFDYKFIKKLYDKLIEEEPVLIAHGINITDDAMVAEMYSDIKVKLVEGDYTNIKVTTPDDLVVAENLVKQSGE
ncbi:MAG: 2-C-methyl-D-erythritol 4-phosphate cytidylyltransferase [Butyrivibrio sp.]|nr:2-C-methyl-D-erythritol 4-phosphate cytidylyltransferase [Butyrivibrio sp.]